MFHVISLENSKVLLVQNFISVSIRIFYQFCHISSMGFCALALCKRARARSLSLSLHHFRNGITATFRIVGHLIFGIRCCLYSFVKSNTQTHTHTQPYMHTHIHQRNTFSPCSSIVLFRYYFPFQARFI